MNKNRESILESLRASNRPLSAADIGSLLGDAADTATVYRGLHYLEEKGLVESFILHCESHGTQRYYTPSAETEGGGISHHHWFHCERCHRFTDLGDCRMDALVRGFEKEKGIAVRTHTLYLTGTCRACARRRGAGEEGE